MDSAELNLMRFRAKELNKLLVAPPKTNLEVKTESLESYKDAWAYNDPPELINTSIKSESTSQEVKVESKINSIRLQNLKDDVMIILTDSLTSYAKLSNESAEGLWDEFCKRHPNPLQYTKHAISQECFSYLHPTDGYETAEEYDHRKSTERKIEEVRASDNRRLCTRIKLILVSILVSMIVMLLFLNHDGKYLKSDNMECSICHPVVYK